MSDADYLVSDLPPRVRDLLDERNAVLGENLRLKQRIAELEAERADANGDRLQALARRFQGIDVKYRSTPGRWSATNYASKNERAEYRITREGSTAALAIAELLTAVAVIDAGGKP